MATFEDTFNGSSPDLVWVSARGGSTPTTNGDGTASISGAGWQYARADLADTESSDMYAEVLIDVANIANDRRVLLFVRASQAPIGTTAAETYYAAVLNLANPDAGAPTLSFLRFEGPGAPVGGGPIDGDVTVTLPDAPFTFRFEAEGSTFRAYFNSQLVKTSTSTGGPAGTLGGLGGNGAGTDVRFDLFEIGDLDDDGGGGDPGDPDEPGVIEFESASDDAIDSTENITVAAPAGVQAGDFLVAVCTTSQTSGDAGVTGFAGTGWESAADWGNDGNDLIPASSVLYRVATNSEPSSHTFARIGANPQDNQLVHILRFSGVDTSDPFAAGPVVLDQTSSGNPVPAPTLDVPVDGAMVVTSHTTAAWDDGAFGDDRWTSGSGGDKATDWSGNWAHMGTFYRSVDAGSVGPWNASLSVGEDEVGPAQPGRGISFALRPTTGDPTPPGDERVNLAPNPAVDPTGTGWGNAGSNSGSGAAFRVEGLDVFPDRSTGWRTGPEASVLQTLLYAPRISIEPGQAYAPSLYAHALVADEYTFYAEWHDSSNGFLSNAGPPQLIPIGDAQTVRVSFATGEAPAAAATLRLSASSPSAQSPLILSQALYEEGSELRPYFDGDSEGAEWTGERGNSPSRLAVEDGGEPDSDEAAVRHGWGVPLPASDEFDTLGAPDPSMWERYEGEGHDGNGIRDPEQVEIISGSGNDPAQFLRLTGLPDGRQGGLSHQFDQQYGRWECRARAMLLDPDNPGSPEPYHAVLILWPESDVWPEDGEYDFFEVVISQSGADAWIHYPHRAGINNVQVAPPTAPVDITEFHNYAIDWRPDGITLYIDAEEWASWSDLDDYNDPPARTAPIQHMPSGHLTIQVDAFTDPTEAGVTLGEAYLDVAWARIYPPAERQLGPGAYAGRNQSTTVGSSVTLSGIDGDGTTSRTWTVISGPERYGDEIGTEASVEFTPQLPGTYVLEYTASGAGTSSDRVKVHAARPDGSVARVNLALNPQFGDDPGEGQPTTWYGGDQVPVSGLAGITTGLRSEGQSVATGRFLVADSNWHNEEDRITVSAIVVADAATTITAGVDFYTALNGGSFIENGAKVSNSTQVQVPAGVPTWVTVRDQPRDPDAPPHPETGEPHPYSLRQAMVVPSNAVAALLTASSVGDTPFLVTGLLVEHGTEAPDGTLPGIVTTGGE